MKKTLFACIALALSACSTHAVQAQQETYPAHSTFGLLTPQQELAALTIGGITRCADYFDIHDDTIKAEVAYKIALKQSAENFEVISDKTTAYAFTKVLTQGYESMSLTPNEEVDAICNALVSDYTDI